MIKKVVEITKDTPYNDTVELSWFDMQKPNLTALTQKGVEFVVKVKFTHLHEDDMLICEDGTAIGIKRSEDTIYELTFTDHLTFAKTAYEIGNRHQPISIEEDKITVLDDISLHDIIKLCEENALVHVNKTEGLFRPNGKAHHSH